MLSAIGKSCCQEAFNKKAFSKKNHRKTTLLESKSFHSSTHLLFTPICYFSKLFWSTKPPKHFFRHCKMTLPEPTNSSIFAVWQGSKYASAKLRGKSFDQIPFTVEVKKSPSEKLCKKASLKISQNSQENTVAGVSFLIKLHATLQPC